MKKIAKFEKVSYNQFKNDSWIHFLNIMKKK